MKTFNYSFIWLSIAWFGVGLLLYLSLSPPLEVVSDGSGRDKPLHLLAYLVLAGWFGQLYENTALHKSMLYLLLLGIGLECIQPLTGYREFHWHDLFMNMSGVGLAWIFSLTSAGNLLLCTDQALKRS